MTRRVDKDRSQLYSWKSNTTAVVVGAGSAPRGSVSDQMSCEMFEISWFFRRYENKQILKNDDILKFSNIETIRQHMLEIRIFKEMYAKVVR